MSRWLKHVGNMFRLIAIIASVAECIVYVAMPTYLRPIRVVRKRREWVLDTHVGRLC